MARRIGLTASGENVWDGVLLLDFTLVSRNRRTARYVARFQGKAFDVYVPLFILSEEHRGAPPQSLQIALDRSARAVKRLGFSDEKHPLEAGLGVCEFEVAERKVNSVMYRFVLNKQTFSLYVPNTVFGKEPYPKRLYLRLMASSGG